MLLDTFSIAINLDYLLNKLHAKGSSKIQNIIFKHGSVVNDNTALFVGKDAIDVDALNTIMDN